MYLYLTDHVSCQSAAHFFALPILLAFAPRSAPIMVHYMQESNHLHASHLLVLKVFAIISYF